MAPVVGHRAPGHTNDIGHFLRRKAAKEAKCDYTSRSLIALCESIEGIVEGEQLLRIECLVPGNLGPLGKGDLVPSGAALHSAAAPRVIDQKLFHDYSADGEEMRFAFPVSPSLMCQL